VIEAVIFDFDGVIIDSGSDIVNAVQHTRAQFDQPALTAGEIISYVGHGAEYLVRHSFADCGEVLIFEALAAYRQYYLENALLETKLYTGVKQTLDHVKTKLGCQTALVTNKPEDIAWRILDGLNIKASFDLVLGPESVKRMKPDPEGIIKVLTEFGLPASCVVMVGDSHTDIEAGKGAGTLTCGVTYGLGNKIELIQSRPDFLISNITELLNYIE
jgi:phosphoglycolate phosphatase